MIRTMNTKPVIVVLTGASGAGKTTLVSELNKIGLRGVEGFNCDRVRPEIAETIDPGDMQAEILRFWLTRIKEDRPDIELALLDTQIRPHRAIDVLTEAGVASFRVVLVDCDPAERNRRLHKDRNQPELSNAQMDCWAAYLRGQADALELPII